MYGLLDRPRRTAGNAQDQLDGQRIVEHPLVAQPQSRRNVTRLEALDLRPHPALAKRGCHLAQERERVGEDPLAEVQRIDNPACESRGHQIVVVRGGNQTGNDQLPLIQA